jgi:hypothetical protein
LLLLPRYRRDDVWADRDEVSWKRSHLLVKGVEKSLRILDILTNIAIVAAACAIIAIGWFRYGSAAAVGKPPDLRPSIGLKAGNSVPIGGIDWSQSRSTVVLVLSTSCQFCAESAAFYRQISMRRNPELKVVAVFREDVTAGRAFLSEHGVDVDGVVQQSPEELRIRGVPALLVVSPAGTLTKAWVGKVGPATEKEILRQLPTAGS